jgi:hypothetical protein
MRHYQSVDATPSATVTFFGNVYTTNNRAACRILYYIARLLTALGL